MSPLPSMIPVACGAALSGGLAFAQALAPTPVIVTGVSAVQTQPRPFVRIELQNTGSKAVVGYVLRIQSLNADGVIMNDYNVGRDHLSYDPTANDGILQPSGGFATDVEAVDKNAASAKATVIGAVFADRTGVGEVGGIFAVRHQIADSLHRAINALGSAPSTPTAFHAAIAQAREYDEGRVDQRLSSKLNQTANQSINIAVLPTATQWKAITDDLQAEEDFWTTQAKQAGGAK